MFHLSRAQLGQHGRNAIRPSRARVRRPGAVLALATLAILGWSTTQAPAAVSPMGPRTLPAGPKAAAGEVVARFELDAPSANTFTLRGTLPVPPNTYPIGNLQVPFAIKDSAGAVSVTQHEIVTWYPNKDAQGAAVIELLARVKRPAGASPGDRIHYDVIRQVHDQRHPNITPAAATLVNEPNKVHLRAKDVYGHTYKLDLLSPNGARNVRSLGSQVERYGVAALTASGHDVMRPQTTNIGAPNGALERLFGVHKYITVWGQEDVIGLDLRFHNGTSGLDKQNPLDDPQDNLYFKSIELVMPSGWSVQQAFNDPFFGTPYNQGGKRVFPIVKPNSDGSLHVMPPRFQFHRRFTLSPSSAASRGREIVNMEGLAFCVDGFNAQGAQYYSWWNRSTSNYFPQRQALPDLSYLGDDLMRTRLTQDLNKFTGFMSSGNAQGVYPLHSPALGWAHPWGTKYGGMTGGTEIFMYDGLTTADSASRNGIRLYQLTHRMLMDRHSVALYNLDGDPTQVEQWTINGPSGPYVQMNFYLKLLAGPDPFGFDKAPTFQVDRVTQLGKRPSYETDLIQHDPIDLQHTIRATRAAKVLAWLSNDPIAKDDLRLQAELSMLSYTLAANNSTGATIPSTMLADQVFVQGTPGKGFAFGRGEGWCIDSVVAAHAFEGNLYRNRAKAWCHSVLDLIEAGQAPCSGAIEAIVSNKLLNGNFRVRQAIEEAIIQNALVSMNATVFQGIDPGRKSRIDNINESSIHGFFHGENWNQFGGGPWNVIAVGPLGAGSMFCSSLPTGTKDGGGDKWQSWSSYAYGYQLTNQMVYLDKAAEAMGTTTANLVNTIKGDWFQGIENRAALIRLAQDLLGG